MAEDKNHFEGMKCDVCGRDGVVGVASSGLGPVSFSYCGECLKNRADPLFMFAALLEDCGGPNNLADWVKSLTAWKDGRYLSFDEIVETVTTQGAQ